MFRPQQYTRRRILKDGGAAAAGLMALTVAGPPGAFGQTGDVVIPWLDQPAANPIPGVVGNLLKWEALDSQLTPADNFFFVSHYGIPQSLAEATWYVQIGGLVARPRSLSIADLKARERHEVEFTLECSGNNGTGLAFFIGGIGNARWAGARLAQLLEQAAILDEASEVIFWGADSGKVTVRDNSGVVAAGRTGTTEPDATGGLDLTFTEQFARSMSLREALSRDNILCYEMNGQPLPREHGFPVRLIAPAWYGVANVKWLTRIEIVDRRFAGRFMARDYVSIREEQRGDQTVWTFATVGRDRLKSAPAKVIRRNGRYSIMGAAWGAPIAYVQVQVDNGSWIPASLDAPATPRFRSYGWRFWTVEWGTPNPGEHTVRSRAIDIDGNVQPAPDDPFLASRRTYWESNGQITRRVSIPA
jgi:DMSO/TMAO reductase YedYZ molybdopterin-dependent catalytic subunit